MIFKALVSVFLLQVAACSSLPRHHEYLVFSGPVQQESRFEPSGVAWGGTDNRFVIFNDKDDEPPVYVYKHNEMSGRLELLDNLSVYREDGSRIKIKKFEDASASLANDGTIYVVTSCDRDDRPYNVLVRMTLDDAGKAAFEEMTHLTEALNSLRTLSGFPYMKVEAMALAPGDKYLYLGIREVGADHKHPQRVVMIFRLDLGDESKRLEKVFEMETQGLVGRVEGISSLEYDPMRGEYLMLTSFEGKGNSKKDVGSHLWAIERNSLEQNHGETSGKAELLASFSHKGEGVAVDGHGRILVVFDDDASRKEEDEKEAQKQDRFNIRQNQAYYLFMR
ncbi:MAG: esterase-like activity of phytase family protein [Deltaproteobacteria bacterium]|jgi:hypothetical protein